MKYTALESLSQPNRRPGPLGRAVISIHSILLQDSGSTHMFSLVRLYAATGTEQEEAAEAAEAARTQAERERGLG